ncbi:MAG: AMP-binding protein, partial [bacterium]|nr:AMP-binding protein [bacterium]
LDCEKVTVLSQTPSAFRQLIQTEQALTAPHTLYLRYVIFGGEVLEFHRLKPWFNTHGDEKPQLINMYGITETTVHVTYRPLTLADVENPNSVIGRPLPDLQTYILGADLQLVPVGIPGELHIGGAGLSRGYLNRPDLTAEKFIPHPFSLAPGGRLYKSGDLARYLPDGEIEFLGRIDLQVKIRGFRVELGEIETALRQHPAVQEAIVLAREDSSHGKRLVAYVVSAQSSVPSVEKLRQFLTQKLPEYMIPSTFVFLEEFPLTPSGKIDRKTLPDPERTRPDLEEQFISPRTPVEEKLARIWCEVLQLDQIGIYDNFFVLGGHSLLATQVISRANRIFELEIPLRSLFELPTIAGSAEYIEQVLGIIQKLQAPINASISDREEIEL